jgi:hypothetical protein
VQIGGVDKDGTVTVLQWNADGASQWARVAWMGGRWKPVTGYVHQAYLRPVSPVVSPAPATKLALVREEVRGPMATTTTNTKKATFPRMLGRFINLEGGLYGFLDLVAISREVLELQTGEDFVRFDHEQAKNLRDTIDKFLAFEHPHTSASSAVTGTNEGTEVAEIVVQEDEQLVARRPRRSRRRA